jgi:hypothetical protein
VENAHGKAPLCRAPENMRTAKIETHGNHRFSLLVYDPYCALASFGSAMSAML